MFEIVPSRTFLELEGIMVELFRMLQVITSLINNLGDDQITIVDMKTINFYRDEPNTETQ